MIKPFYQDSHCVIYNADCTEVLPQLSDIDMVLMDPPYGHGNQQHDLQARLKAHKGKLTQPIANDTHDTLRPLLERMFGLLERVVNKSHCVCCCCAGGGGPTPTFAWLANLMDRAPWKFFHALVWDKTKGGFGLGWKFRRDYEFVMVNHLKSARLLWQAGQKGVSNLLRHKPIWPGRRVHPNQKPVEMFMDLIRWHGAQRILDPFMGSGTTLVAAKALGRRAIGIDLDPGFCARAAERLQQTIPAAS